MMELLIAISERETRLYPFDCIFDILIQSGFVYLTLHGLRIDDADCDVSDFDLCYALISDHEFIFEGVGEIERSYSVVIYLS